jgi:hypothetical protein
VASFSSGGGKQRRQHWVKLELGRGEKCGRERRKGTRETPGFYMDREREGEAEGGWRPAALPLMAGGQSGARNKRRGETACNGGD